MLKINKSVSLPVTTNPQTPLQAFKERWTDGCGSEDCAGAAKVVLGRGKVPCDIVFIGEAPGESENVLGVPFIGPAGKLLDWVITRSIGEENLHRAADDRPRLTYALTNIVCCIPREKPYLVDFDGTMEGGGKKLAKPDPEAVALCAPRLQEFIRLCDRDDHLKLLVLVGSEATHYLTPGYKHTIKLHREIPQLEIIHPAAILRMNSVQRSLAIQRCVVKISSVVERL